MAEKLIKDLKKGDNIFGCETTYNAEANVRPYEVIRCVKFFEDTYHLYIKDIYGNVTRVNGKGNDTIIVGATIYYTSIDDIIKKVYNKINYLKNAVADLKEMKSHYE